MKRHRIDIGISPMVFWGPFTRSNGTIAARIYERLTKASRRKAEQQGPYLMNTDVDNVWYEQHYRRGVYDAFKALQGELEQ